MVLMYDFGNGDYEFEPTREERQEALRDILNNKDKSELIEALLNIDETEEYFRDDLYEHFEDIARDEYNDNLEYKKDPYAYYGLNERDFH